MSKYFYFAEESRQLRYGDDRKIVVGETHKVAGGIALCERGLHASKRIIDALSYAPGPILYLVELGGEVIHCDDKSAAAERKYIAEFDATNLLREFARKQAMINIHRIEKYCSSNEYDLIIKFLETGDEELRPAAKSIAESVVRTIARSAAESAAESAAKSAARAAAWSAARAAAWLAARSAAWLAAWSVAWSVAEASAANNMLIEMIKKETGWEI